MLSEDQSSGKERRPRLGHSDSFSQLDIYSCKCALSELQILNVQIMNVNSSRIMTMPSLLSLRGRHLEQYFLKITLSQTYCAQCITIARDLLSVDEPTAFSYLVSDIPLVPPQYQQSSKIQRTNCNFTT